MKGRKSLFCRLKFLQEHLFSEVLCMNPKAYSWAEIAAIELSSSTVFDECARLAVGVTYDVSRTRKNLYVFLESSSSVFFSAPDIAQRKSSQSTLFSL